MLATQERPSAKATVHALRAHAALVSTDGAQVKPLTKADFIEEVRIDMVKAMRQEIHFVLGICPRPDMAPLATLVHIKHAVQQMLDSDFSTQVVLLSALRDSACPHVKELHQAMPLLRGSLSEMTSYVQSRINEEATVCALLMNLLAISECHRIQQLRDVIASGYAYMVGPTVAACRGVAR